ncbi:hypothetical protein L211DRAFT_498818 [Terfezia boudieri ATCC MYA-4762]|uniref:Uncharacterized protein n=1 Tax=Terfezia boudieri ATCC MYA-4762 TaxID=1051890 RepID=A0A3N4LGV2_9PEZI|nr:hypothetical protein L211DRAFT_498818 [Terfezia boudieri ATCC MYA-4762]
MPHCIWSALTLANMSSKVINIPRRSSAYGGSPRVLIETIYLNEETNGWVKFVMQYDNAVKRQIKAMLVDSRPLSTMEDVSTSAVSHKIFFFEPLDEERIFSQHYELKIGTVSLQDLLIQEVSSTRTAQQRAFYHRLLDVPSLKNAAGRIFEQATHQLFRKGGKFRLGRILDTSDKTINKMAHIDINQSEEFRSLKEWGATMHNPNS